MTQEDVTIIVAFLSKAAPYILGVMVTLLVIVIVAQIVGLLSDLKVIVHYHADRIRRAEKYEVEELRHELFITKRTLEEAEFRTAISKGD